jgi:hypothetical protein
MLEARRGGAPPDGGRPALRCHHTKNKPSIVMAL